MKRRFTKLIPLEEAKKIVLSNTEPLEEKERVGLLFSSGRVLTEDVKAKFDVPLFDKSAMDGYALRAEDTSRASESNRVKLRCEGTLYAGDLGEIEVEPGTCVKIATGAKLPPNADAVARLENVKANGSIVELFERVLPQQDLIERGADIKKGGLLLKKGEVLTPPKVGSLASLGIAEIEVYKKPRVFIVSSGNEVKKIDEKIEEGEVYDTNSYSLASLVKNCGGDPMLSPPVKDDEKEVERAIENAPIDADLLIMTGGSSVGEKDLIPDVVSKLGHVFFHGIKIRPGMPTLFGEVKDKLIFGLPGYPTSCIVSGYRLVSPVIKKLAHLPHEPKTVKARLAKRYESFGKRRQLLPVKFDNGLAYPAFKGAGAITSTAHADGWIEVPEDAGVVEEGEEVEVTLW